MVTRRKKPIATQSGTTTIGGVRVGYTQEGVTRWLSLPDLCEGLVLNKRSQLSRINGQHSPCASKDVAKKVVKDKNDRRQLTTVLTPAGAIAWILSIQPSRLSMQPDAANELLRNMQADLTNLVSECVTHVAGVSLNSTPGGSGVALNSTPGGSGVALNSTPGGSGVALNSTPTHEAMVQLVATVTATTLAEPLGQIARLIENANNKHAQLEGQFAELAARVQNVSASTQSSFGGIQHNLHHTMTTMTAMAYRLTACEAALQLCANAHRATAANAEPEVESQDDEDDDEMLTAYDFRQSFLLPLTYETGNRYDDGAALGELCIRRGKKVGRLTRMIPTERGSREKDFHTYPRSILKEYYARQIRQRQKASARQ